MTGTAKLTGPPEADAAVIEQSWTRPERFSAIFERYFGQIHQYLARRVGDKAADDLAAEVFVAAFAHRQRYDHGNMLLTPDGHKIISVVASFYWHGRPGFIPQGSFARITRSMLPSQCQGTGRSVYKRTPYCINRLKELERGKTGKSAALNRALSRNAAQQQAESSTVLAFTEFSAATARPVKVLGRKARLLGE